MSFKRAGQYHEQRMDPLSVKGGKIDRFFKKKKPDHGIEAGKDHGVFDVRDGDPVPDAGRAGLFTGDQHFH